jgi:hypothetical protein
MHVSLSLSFFEQGRAPKDPEAALNIIGGNTFYKEDL